jgi:O-antigen/teichoic acid export membrane protein
LPERSEEAGPVGLAKESLLWFLFHLASALLGFIGLTYFSRALGARILGIYFLFFSLLSLFNLLSNLGLQPATIKRISEGRDTDEFFTASLLLRLVPFALLSSLILLSRDPLYRYMGADLSLPLVGILGLFQFADLARETLHGEKKVALGGFIDFVQQFSKIGAQVLLVLFGTGLLGLVYGLGIGVFAALLVGFLLIDARPKPPRREHFRSLIEFSKFSFGNAVGGYVYEWAQIAIIGLLLTRVDVGIYGIAQSIAYVSILASQGVSNALFPTVSGLSSRGSDREVARVFREGMIYTGLLVLPAFAGSLVLAEEVLGIVFGREFAAGALALILLLLSQVLRGWQMISVRVLEGINRPDIVFRINLLTTTVNVVGTFFLVYAFGLAGAAATVVLTILLSLWLNARALRKLILLSMPYRELGHEIFASIILVGALLLLKKVLAPVDPLDLSILVGVGAFVHFATLFAVSPGIRSKVFPLVKSKKL